MIAGRIDVKCTLERERQSEENRMELERRLGKREEQRQEKRKHEKYIDIL